MNILTFILLLYFLCLFGILYILSEINITYSTYCIRRKKDESIYFNERYYQWFIRKEIDLIKLYEEELCENMKLNFDDFCIILYNGGTINYI